MASSFFFLSPYHSTFLYSIRAVCLENLLEVCGYAVICHAAVTEHGIVRLHPGNGLDGFSITSCQSRPAGTHLAKIEHLLPAISFHLNGADSSTPRSSITWNSKSSGVRSPSRCPPSKTDPADRLHPVYSKQASYCFRPDAGSGSQYSGSAGAVRPASSLIFRPARRMAVPCQSRKVLHIAANCSFSKLTRIYFDFRHLPYSFS